MYSAIVYFANNRVLIESEVSVRYYAKRLILEFNSLLNTFERTLDAVVWCDPLS